MMDVQQRSILNLVYSGLTGKSVPVADEFDLAAAIPTLIHHQIQPLCFLGAINCGIDRKHPAMQRLYQNYVQGMAYSERQMQVLNQLCKAFEANEIDYLLLKGSVLKQLYPKPELRLMGDADILIREEQYGRIIPVMEELGFTQGEIGPYDYSWCSSALHAELHYRLASFEDKDFLDYFGNGWMRAVSAETKHQYAYSKEDHLVYLFMHFAKHYRDSGIGIRHAVDFWVYENKYENLDRKYLQAELEKLRLWEFYVNVKKMLAVWFCGEELDAKSDFITDVIFRSGAYGAHETLLISKGVRASARSGSSRTAGIWRMFALMFPGCERMSARYPLVKKVPLLLPVFWIDRGVRAILFKPKKLAQCREEIAVATAKKVSCYEEALNYVGLDFNFKE